MSLKLPTKHLVYSESNFAGYWVQLNALIRHNDHADQVLDGILTNPLQQLRLLEDDDDFRTTLRDCYSATGGRFPPDAKLLHDDPIGSIKEFRLAVATLRDQNEEVNQWLTINKDAIDNYRAGVKFIYEKAVATLTAEQSALFVTDVEYGAGPLLLERLRHKQQRQTNMGLFTLFVSLITLSLKPRETISSLFSRARLIRSRLSAWKPPILLPDQLILVCVLHLLPREYSSTRTIIMSKREATLSTAYDMLLDAENADANLISKTIGSGKSTVSNGLISTSQALVSDTHLGLIPKKAKKRTRRKTGDVRPPSEKCKSEGPCSYHGTRSTHASCE